MFTVSRRCVRILSIIALAGSALGAGSLTRAEPVQMVLAIATHAGTSPKSAIGGTIPGGAGAQSDPRFTNTGRGYHAPTGSSWSLGVVTNLTPPVAFVVGTGLNVPGLAGRDVVTVSTTGDPLNLNSVQSIPKINSSGQWAVASGSTAGGGQIMKWDGTSLVTLFKAGDALPGGVGTCGGTFSDAGITNSGNVFFEATVGAAGLQSSGPYGVYTTVGAGSAILEIGTTIPEDQAGGAMATWFGASNLIGISHDAAGGHWLALGKIGVTTDLSVVVDNKVKIQKGSAIPNSAFISAVNTISDAYMESNGDWYARGTNVDSVAWVVRNGVVVATSGAPIVEGSSEHWKVNTAFTDVKGNPSGNFVITGITDNADTSRNQAIVLNGLRVLARLSDPVDLNADGTFAGSLYLHTIQDKGIYCPDGYYYFGTRLKAVPTGTTTTLGNNSSFVRVRACPADFNGSGDLAIQDIFDFLNAWFAGSLAADFNRSGDLAVQDIFDFLNGWFGGC